MGTLKVATYTSRGILFNNDCLDLLKNLERGSIKTFFADPPFNLGKAYGENLSDNRSRDEYLDWCYAWLNEAARVLVDGGSLFVYNLPQWNIYLSHHLVEKLHLDFRHWIAISMKNGFTRPKHLCPAHYSLIYFTKGKPATFNKDEVRYPLPLCRHCRKPIPDWGGYKKKLNPRGINLSDIWTDLSPVRHKKSKKRPVGVNELPTQILERVILLTTNPNDVILDPFGGCGNTFEVADRYSRCWIGSEAADCEPVIDQLKASKDIEWEPDSLPEQVVRLLLRETTLLAHRHQPSPS